MKLTAPLMMFCACLLSVAASADPQAVSNSRQEGYAYGYSLGVERCQQKQPVDSLNRCGYHMRMPDESPETLAWIDACMDGYGVGYHDCMAGDHK